MVSAPHKGSKVSSKGLVRLGTARMKSGERVKLAARDHAVPGYGGTVINGSRAKVDPEESIGVSKERARAFGNSRRGFGTRSVSISVGFVIRVWDVKEVEVVVIRVRV